MKFYFKIITVFVIRLILKIFYMFPIKNNRILFSSFSGKSFNCNPKYIFMYLYDKIGGNIEYVWCINDKNKLPTKYNVKCVSYLSIAHIYYLITSKIIVNNQVIEPIIPKRDKQIFINTTHGSGAYKKGGSQADYLSRPNKLYMENMMRIRSKMTDYVISACNIYTDIFSKKEEYNVDKSKFLPIGMPRNDIFLSDSNNKTKILELRKNIGRIYNIDSDLFWCIYAPTYRGHYNSVETVDLRFDVDQLIHSIYNRFAKKAIILFRHHSSAANMSISGNNVCDVSDYQDMQELLYVSDMFITDYSSCMWDFSLSFKPGFLYVPDLNKYEHNTKFHTPISQWPFVYSTNMEELCKQIELYNDKDSEKKIRSHHQELGSYEDGHATEKICKLIIDNIIK